MSDTSAPKPRRISFWLTVSLLFNLLLLGLIAGMLVRQMPDRDRGRDRPSVERDISPDTRRAMFGLMRESYRESRPEREVRNAARDELAKALKTEPFNAEQVREAFAALRSSEQDVHAATHEAMIGRLEALPSDQRAAMADLLARGPDRRSRDRRDPPPPPQD